MRKRYFLAALAVPAAVAAMSLGAVATAQAAPHHTRYHFTHTDPVFRNLHAKHEVRGRDITRSVAANREAMKGEFAPSGGTVIGSDANCVGAPSTGFWSRDNVALAPYLPTDEAADCGQGGYVASGNTFVRVSGQLTVPGHTATPADAPEYLALDNSTANTPNWARGGFQYCHTVGPFCGTSHWQAFVAVFQPTLNAPTFGFAQIPAANEGDGISVSVSENQFGNAIDFSITQPNQPPFTPDVAVAGPSYTRVEALADWAFSTPKPAPVPPASDKIRDTQFLGIQITSSTGVTGSLKNPAWLVDAVEATSNGYPAPAGTVVAQPSYLWNGGQNFGDWRYPF